MNNRNKGWLPNLLIGLGAVLVLSFGIYTAAHYPWRMLLAQWGLVELEEPPDPDPLPVSSTSLTQAGPAMPSGALPEVLPNEPEQKASGDIELITLGIIKIPELQLSENIVEGSGEELFYGVGHVPATALPGAPGNCVLAGHRNYIVMRPFRYLDKVEEGDQVLLTYGGVQYTYEVFDIFVVEPDDSWVLQAQEGETHMLTLLTCTPVVGLTHRMVVRCRLADSTPHP